MQTKQKFTGGSPKFAIPQWVADIALKYGDTVSKGIQEMESKILELQGEVAARKSGEIENE